MRDLECSFPDAADVNIVDVGGIRKTLQPLLSGPVTLGRCRHGRELDGERLMQRSGNGRASAPRRGMLAKAPPKSRAGVERARGGILWQRVTLFWIFVLSREMGLKPTATLGKQHPRCIVLSAAGARVPDYTI